MAIRDEDGDWTGLGIELWRDTARRMGVDDRFEPTDLEGLVAGLEDGSLDLSVAGVTIIAERERRINFSHAFHASGLGIAVGRMSPGERFAGLACGLVSTAFLQGVAAPAWRER
ncbi:MAG: transporter substrate-binding domain-containing protein [Planctomycetota bacterium]